MLQSVKRAWRLDSGHQHLHDCLLRFHVWLDAARPSLNQHVAAVLDSETQQMMQGRSAVQMAEQFMSGAAQRSQAAALWGARALARLLPHRTHHALAHVTAMHYPDLTIEGCVEVLDSLREGDFGPCESEIEQYISACHTRFPYALAFKPPGAAQPEEDVPLQPKELAN
ncbi:N-alpha-acetyltransferase 15, NatA auxiliary subunit [Papilio xuthus]|uniref:N-alpha-acetyltransferase 15, NatA auxiliary subunit n=1 Tax=Papilio xuthus TaxID=66420 RepID=A0A194PYV3_PAPXU|nr:N-alpha-acetyltransferase 15, NatA auxiliary subunit [Papilio xuthus]